jgi:hypothetical protein
MDTIPCVRQKRLALDGHCGWKIKSTKEDNQRKRNIKERNKAISIMRGVISKSKGISDIVYEDDDYIDIEYLTTRPGTYAKPGCKYLSSPRKKQPIIRKNDIDSIDPDRIPQYQRQIVHRAVKQYLDYIKPYGRAENLHLHETLRKRAKCIGKMRKCRDLPLTME